MIYRLHPDYPELFPDPEGADPEGLVAVGGDLSVRRLLAAYGAGIFPWYGEGQPLLWWSPDPRCVLFPEKFRIPHTVRKEIRKCGFSVTVNQAFCDVMTGCAATPRPDQDGTWIMPEMVDAYASLHELGFAHSVEVWSMMRPEIRSWAACTASGSGGRFSGNPCSTCAPMRPSWRWSA